MPSGQLLAGDHAGVSCSRLGSTEGPCWPPPLPEDGARTPELPRPPLQPLTPAPLRERPGLEPLLTASGAKVVSVPVNRTQLCREPGAGGLQQRGSVRAPACHSATSPRPESSRTPGPPSATWGQGPGLLSSEPPLRGPPRCAQRTLSPHQLRVPAAVGLGRVGGHLYAPSGLNDHVVKPCHHAGHGQPPNSTCLHCSAAVCPARNR